MMGSARIKHNIGLEDGLMPVGFLPESELTHG